MKKNKRLVFLLVFLIVSVVATQYLDLQVFADVGNTFSGGGSSSKSSGGSYGGGSSYSSGSGDLGLLFYILLDVIPFPINIILVVLILGLVYKSMNTRREVMSSGNDYVPVNEVSEDFFIEKIRKNDTNFSKNEFKNYVNTVFIKVQEAWEAREWHLVRPFESNELFERHNEQMNEYISNNLYPHLDGQEILATDIARHEIDGKYEYVTVKLTANIIDYTTNANNEIVEGSKTQHKFRIYKLNFKRVNGVLTKEIGETNVTNCPKCGAPNGITSSGKCEYCGSVITTGEYGWVLDEYSQWRD